MKIEIEQNCLWLREAESPDALFSSRENWMGQLFKHECLLLIVEPCASSAPSSSIRNRSAPNF